MTTLKFEAEVDEQWKAEVASANNYMGCPYPIDLRCLVGSSVHGISIGSDDRDEMGICVEPLTRVISLGFEPGEFEQFIYRDAAVREGRHDAPSQAGDLDLTVYSLRKWARLALQGNPTVLLLLFAPVLSQTSLGRELRWSTKYFASRAAGRRFRGYLQKQRADLYKGRPELIEKYGWDTKAGGHMLRLGYQGVEYMNTGKLTLPLPEALAQRCVAVRKGEIDVKEFSQEVMELEEQILHLIDHGPLPEQPDYEKVGKFVREVYLGRWCESVERQKKVYDSARLYWTLLRPDERKRLGVSEPKLTEEI